MSNEKENEILKKMDKLRKKNSIISMISKKKRSSSKNIQLDPVLELKPIEESIEDNKNYNKNIMEEKDNNKKNKDNKKMSKDNMKLRKSSKDNNKFTMDNKDKNYILDPNTKDIKKEKIDRKIGSNNNSNNNSASNSPVVEFNKIQIVKKDVERIKKKVHRRSKSIDLNSSDGLSRENRKGSDKLPQTPKPYSNKNLERLKDDRFKTMKDMKEIVKDMDGSALKSKLKLFSNREEENKNKKFYSDDGINHSFNSFSSINLGESINISFNNSDNNIHYGKINGEYEKRDYKDIRHNSDLNNVLQKHNIRTDLFFNSDEPSSQSSFDDKTPTMKSKKLSEDSQGTQQNNTEMKSTEGELLSLRLKLSRANSQIETLSQQLHTEKRVSEKFKNWNHHQDVEMRMLKKDLWTLSEGLRKVLDNNKELTQKYEKMEDVLLDVLIRYREQISNEEKIKIEKEKEKEINKNTDPLKEVNQVVENTNNMVKLEMKVERLQQEKEIILTLLEEEKKKRLHLNLMCQDFVSSFTKSNSETRSDPNSPRSSSSSPIPKSFSNHLNNSNSGRFKKKAIKRGIMRSFDTQVKFDLSHKGKGSLDKYKNEDSNFNSL